jgi:hypothetical protein
MTSIVTLSVETAGNQTTLVPERIATYASRGKYGFSAP